MYKVSVVVVVYNTEKYLGECLDSIFAQTLDGVELVVVDNASNEATRRVLKEKISGRANVVCRLLEENVGGATGVTIGMKAASGEYLYTMDSDDILPPGALEALYTAAKANGCDVVIGRAISIMDGQLRRMRFPIDEITWSRELVTDSLEEQPQLMVAPFYWGKLFRREFMERHDIRMQDGVLNADRYMSTNALRLSSRTAVIRDVACIWRRFSGGQSSVTMTARQLSSIRDRMKSLTDTALLFPEGKLRQYALVSNLARVFLPVRAISNPEIRPEYSRLIKEYLALTDESAIIESTVLPVRYKAYAWLAKRDRFDDIVTLAAKRGQKTRFDGNGTFVSFSGIDGLPTELLRQRTITGFSSVSTEVKEGILRLRCSWKDASQCPPEATAVYAAPYAELAVAECARPVSSLSGGCMDIEFALDADTILSLTRPRRPDTLFLECRSGHSVFLAPVPLDAAALTALAAQLPDPTLASPAKAARLGTIRRILEPALKLTRTIRSRLR